MHEAAGRIFRYSVVGIATAGIYFALTILLSEVFKYSLMASSIFSYTIAIIFQYISHSIFTFRVRLYDKSKMIKFLTAIFAGYLISSALIKVGERFDLDNVFIVALIVLIIPVMNYVVMSLLVFVEADDGQGRGGH